MVFKYYDELNYLFDNKVLLVCDSSINYLKINDYFNTRSNIVRFSDFVSNPLYESVVKGVELFHSEQCVNIIAVGGGSAIDVAKCIKLFSNMDRSRNYLEQRIVPNDVALVAIPTTAGTGSEATRYAVIYHNGVKQSISDYSCIPSVVLFDPSVLDTLPMYQKKATMLDAMCHAIESFWSINSTEESKKYSSEAIKLILDNYQEYLKGDNKINNIMLEASNLAGKAINITQTTAGHAMSYKLTSLYGISHGHAAALCVNSIWPFMVNNIEKCVDSRGKQYLLKTFNDIAYALGCDTAGKGFKRFNALLNELNLLNQFDIKDEDYSILKSSVNIERLKNNPVELTENDIDSIYHNILGD